MICYDHEIATQSAMIADMHRLGWNHPGFTDPDTRQPLTLGEVFDRYAVALAVLIEKECDPLALDVPHPPHPVR